MSTARRFHEAPEVRGFIQLDTRRYHERKKKSKSERVKEFFQQLWDSEYEQLLNNKSIDQGGMG